MHGTQTLRGSGQCRGLLGAAVVQSPFVKKLVVVSMSVPYCPRFVESLDAVFVKSY